MPQRTYYLVAESRASDAGEVIAKCKASSREQAYRKLGHDPYRPMYEVYVESQLPGNVYDPDHMVPPERLTTW